MVRHVRFHGRGGEGVKLASRILTRGGFLAGMTVQDSPLYGAERRGAPVVAFARLGDEPILERGYIERPDATVLMDASLLGHPDAAVLAGLDADSVVLVNTPLRPEEIARRHAIAGTVVTLDVSSVVLEVIGKHFLSAAVAGVVAKVGRLFPWETVAEAVRIELAAAAVSPEAVNRNLIATQRLFEAAPSLGLRPPRSPHDGAAQHPEPLFVVPHLPPRIAAPTIGGPPTSPLRVLDGWRVYRPVINRSGCSRCFLCFAVCPEGAIRLDEQNFPVIDYVHCKGCLICAEECPPGAISQIREEAA